MLKSMRPKLEHLKPSPMNIIEWHRQNEYEKAMRKMHARELRWALRGTASHRVIASVLLQTA